MWEKSDWFEWIEIVQRHRERIRLETLLLIRRERLKKLKQLYGESNDSKGR